MNILLARPDGIGDEILSLPVATALRRAMPGARLSFLSSAYAAPVLAHHPDLDEVLTVTSEGTTSTTKPSELPDEKKPKEGADSGN